MTADGTIPLQIGSVRPVSEPHAHIPDAQLWYIWACGLDSAESKLIRIALWAITHVLPVH